MPPEPPSATTLSPATAFIYVGHNESTTRGNMAAQLRFAKLWLQGQGPLMDFSCRPGLKSTEQRMHSSLQAHRCTFCAAAAAAAT